MKIVATLGPEGTYSDIASKKIIENKDNMKIEYYPTIIKATRAVKDDVIAVVPFENKLDGFVFESLDNIIEKKLNISSQLVLPVDFTFCANTKNIDQVKNVYAQFKAYGQCLDFLSDKNFNIIKTESNIVSLNMLLSSGAEFGAIVPSHAVENMDFPLKISHIIDSESNETRFFVVDNNKPNFNVSKNTIASLVITSIVDKPGILYNILGIFAEKKINLKNILSRPAKTEMGAYNFYVEVSVDKENVKTLKELLVELENSEDFKVILLGVYEVI